MSWAFCLPTGVAGYLVHSGPALLDGETGFSRGTDRVVQGDARGWGMAISYFYVIYFAILLIHRERRDESKCMRKYGKDWEEYKKIVPWRIIPGVY